MDTVYGTHEASGQIQNPVATTSGNSQTALSDGGNVVRSCACCGASINDRFLLHMADRYWHTNCLRCSCCHVTLEDSNSCFVKSGLIFCRSDYMRLFNSRGSCGSCGQTIGAGELVNKTEHAVAGVGRAVYHVQCFKCATCRQQLMMGDRYGIVNGAILCERDLVRASQGQ